MGDVGLIYDPLFVRHDTGEGHPERPERLAAILRRLKESHQWDHFVHLSAKPAEKKFIVQIHRPEYLQDIEQKCAAGERLLDDGDTVVCSESFHIATLAAGAALRAVDEVMMGNVRRVFCALRPPGHHAEQDRAMGFCLLNNVAIAARYAQLVHGCHRVAIVDWDVHHGNGTQSVFYEDPTVLYISLHQYPLWPGTGSAQETGASAGEGFTLNCPMKPGSGEPEYLHAFRTAILPALDQFRPELLFISAGFDAHVDDPLANICLTETSFEKMTAMICDVANRYSGGKVVSVLEGGYNLEALSRCVALHMSMLGKS